MNHTDQLRNHQHLNQNTSNKSGNKDDVVSFTRNEGFITELPTGDPLQPFTQTGKDAEENSDSQLLATSASNNVLSSRGRLTGNPIKFI